MKLAIDILAANSTHGEHPAYLQSSDLEDLLHLRLNTLFRSSRVASIAVI